MIRATILIALLGCSTATAAAAQETPGQTRVWVAAGLGAGMPTSGGDGIANMVQLVYQKDPHHAAIHGLVLHDLDRGTDEIAEAGLVYGRTRMFGRSDATLGAGQSTVAFSACPDDDDGCFTLGVPLIAEAALSGRFIGLGVQAFGNINATASYAGVTLFLQLGRLR